MKSPLNLVGIVLLPLFLVIGVFVGAYSGVSLWFFNMANCHPGDWKTSIPKDEDKPL
jgi:hypothetical protein